MAAHNELGAGLQLAQKDLEIRGAGNILGAEQSGHIAGVGFDLYVRLVGEAVDILDDGELVVRDDAGENRAVTAGDVRHLRAVDGGYSGEASK